MQIFEAVLEHLAACFFQAVLYAKSEYNDIYFKRVSRSVFQGNRKNGRAFKVLQAVDSHAICMYLARYCNEGHDISHVHSQTYYLAACQVSARSL